MRGQLQLVIFVSSLGVRRNELRPSAGAHSAACSRAPAADARARPLATLKTLDKQLQF